MFIFMLMYLYLPLTVIYITLSKSNIGLWKLIIFCVYVTLHVTVFLVPVLCEMTMKLNLI